MAVGHAEATGDSVEMTLDPATAAVYEANAREWTKARVGKDVSAAARLMARDPGEGPILDIGCGNGQYSVFFALLGADVYGFDISAVGIEVANKIAKENDVADRCNFSVQNASHIDYSNEFFDIVFMHEVLHHTIKYPNVKDEILRVLKIGGIVVCADGTVGNPMLRIGRYFTMKGKESMGDVKLKHSDLDELSIGFSDHSIEQMSFFFMGKRVFQNWLMFPPIRWMLYCVKKFDDVLLTLFPGLKRYCGEFVMVLKK